MTQATAGSSAISFMTGSMVALTLGSSTVPLSTPQMRVAVAPVASLAPAVSPSRFCATCDSVPGRLKESLSSPPKREPRVPITRNSRKYETMASTGRRTAQRARYPMELLSWRTREPRIKYRSVLS